MEQPQQMGEPDSRPLFVEIATPCPACAGEGLTDREFAPGVYDVCGRCNGSGFVA